MNEQEHTAFCRAADAILKLTLRQKQSLARLLNVYIEDGKRTAMMSELDHVDLLVICLEALPLPQAVDLLRWWTRHPSEDWRDLTHPSLKWWIKSHAREVLDIIIARGGR